MKTKVTRHGLDSLPPLTDEQREQLRKLDAKPLREIEFSDIPETTREQWIGAERGKFYRPVKRQITARVDADVLEWLRAAGKGYQSRINAILRREMLNSHKRS